MKKAVFTVSVALIAALLTASEVGAQATTTTTTTPKWEFSGGYQLFRLGQVCDTGAITQTCTANRTFPLGFAVDIARNFGPFGVVGEAGWSTDSEDDLDFNSWHLAGGGRYTYRGHDRLWPYGQFLIGMVQDRASGLLNGFDIDRSITSLMFQPGGGVTYKLGEGWGVFGQVDFRRVVLDEENANNLSGGRNDFRLFLGAKVFIP